MRINIYAEEMTDRVELITKEVEGQKFTAVRFYMELPVTVDGKQYKGPFIHRPGDDDSSAVTFWGKRDLRPLLRKALLRLDSHYNYRDDELASETEVFGCVISNVETRMLLDYVWDSQNGRPVGSPSAIPCAYECGARGRNYDRYARHYPNCRFLKKWDSLSRLQCLVGDIRQPTIDFCL